MPTVTKEKDGRRLCARPYYHLVCSDRIARLSQQLYKLDLNQICNKKIQAKIFALHQRFRFLS